MAKAKVQYPLPLRLLNRAFPMIEKLLPGVADRLTVEFFFRPINFKPTAKEEYILESAEKQTLSTGGKKVLTYSWGSGPVIIFTHGWAGRGTQFHEFIKPFCEAGFKCVAFDGPAHGRSTGSKSHMGEFVDILGQLQKIHGPFACSIGHSFGGQVNFYAKINGLDVKKMVLIGSPSQPNEKLMSYLGKINGSSKRIPYFKKHIRKVYDVEFDTVTTSGLAGKLEKMPVLIIHDQNDREVSVEEARALKRLLPFASLVETSNLGHNRILKDQEVVAQCLRFALDQGEI